MSQWADTMAVLPKMLMKYPENCHRAIVETFSESLSDWPDNEVEAFFRKGLGFSLSADDQIKREASGFGLAL
jgi:hypothetical protein